MSGTTTSISASPLRVMAIALRRRSDPSAVQTTRPSRMSPSINPVTVARVTPRRAAISEGAIDGRWTSSAISTA